MAFQVLFFLVKFCALITLKVTGFRHPEKKKEKNSEIELNMANIKPEYHMKSRRQNKFMCHTFDNLTVKQKQALLACSDLPLSLEVMLWLSKREMASVSKRHHFYNVQQPIKSGVTSTNQKSF